MNFLCDLLSSRILICFLAFIFLQKVPCDVGLCLIFLVVNGQSFLVIDGYLLNPFRYFSLYLYRDSVNQHFLLFIIYIILMFLSIYLSKEFLFLEIRIFLLTLSFIYFIFLLYYLLKHLLYELY